MEKKTIIYLALFTLFGFSLLGYWIIENFLSLSFQTVLSSGDEFWIQGIIGLAFGYVSAAIGWKIIETDTLSPVRDFFSKLIQDFNLTFLEIVFIAACAAIGEEILFRGAIQPVLGIWITSIIFVAIHGYLNPFNWRLAIYGIYMTFVIVGIGYMMDYFGLVSAIFAHAMIDVFLLHKLSHDKAPQEEFSEK